MSALVVLVLLLLLAVTAPFLGADTRYEGAADRPDRPDRYRDGRRRRRTATTCPAQVVTTGGVAGPAT